MLQSMNARMSDQGQNWANHKRVKKKNKINKHNKTKINSETIKSALEWPSMNNTSLR